MIITANTMDAMQKRALRVHQGLSLCVLFVTFTPELCCPNVELKNCWASLEVIGGGEVDNASETVCGSSNRFADLVLFGDIDLDASLSFILARSLSTFFSILLTLLACLLLELFVFMDK